MIKINPETAVPSVSFVKKYAGTDVTAASEKQINCLFVKLNAIFVLILDKSFEIWTYGIEKIPP